MEYRTLSQALPDVSAVSFGCWAMGSGVWGPADDDLAVRAAQRALDQGVNLFDTAPGYGQGGSEELLARALAGRRDEVVLVTKFGVPWDAAGNARLDSSPASIRAELEGSLRRLRTDRIDLYLQHWPDPNVPPAEVAATLLELKREGKIRALGFCNVDAAQFAGALSAGPVDAVQVPYCLFIRQVERELLPYCRQQGVGVMVYGALAHGLLGGKMTPQTTFPDEDWRSGKVYGTPNWADQEGLFAPGRFERNLAVVERLKGVAARSGHTVAQLAIAWTLANPAVSVTLAGVKRPAQLEENLGAAGWRLSAGEMEEIERVNG